MNDLIRIATVELTRFLTAKLPDLSTDWWQKHVLDRLSFQQQRIAEERAHRSVEQLDFAALLRVLDQNWYDLSSRLRLTREARSWVKELQSARNKWAHLSSESIPASEMYRDADTLGRLLVTLGADAASLRAVESAKSAALAAMAASGGHSVADIEERSNSTNAQLRIADLGANAMATGSMFKVGDVVVLRSDPTIQLPVIEVIPGGAECRYRVFQNNAKTIYYESQLQAATVVADAGKALTVHDLHAHLTSLQILSPSTANLFSLRSGRVQLAPR